MEVERKSVSFSKLSAFSLASFEMTAQQGGTHAFADAVHGLEDQISLSPQAMGLIGYSVSRPTPQAESPPAEEESPLVSEG